MPVLGPVTSPPTALDIIRPALRRINAIGATEQPSARQISVALEALNGLIDTASVMPQAAVNDTELVFTLPAGAQSMTIGVGMDINTPRPFRIDSAYSRVQGLDQPMDVATKQVYDSVDQKTIGSTWPQLLYYDQGLPTGKVYFWPVADSNLEVHITVLSPLAAYADATTAQVLPGGFQRWLTLATAVEVAPAFQLPVSNLLMQQMQLAYDALTAQNLTVPELDLGGSPTITTRKGSFIAGGLQ